MNRDIRLQYNTGVGRPGISKGADAEQTLQDAARGWKGEGLIIPTDEGKNVWDVVIRKSGDKTFISFRRNLTAPQNFFLITAYNYVLRGRRKKGDHGLCSVAGAIHGSRSHAKNRIHGFLQQESG